MNRRDWPEIDWPGRIILLGQKFISRVTGIPRKTLQQYRYHLCTPSYRNGRMIVDLCEGVPVPRHVQVDWFKLIADLKHAGFSSYRLAIETGIPQSTLIGYKSGAEPKFGDGEILIEYYRAALGKSLDDLPLREIEWSAAKVK